VIPEMTNKLPSSMNMTLASYLRKTDDILTRNEQKRWFAGLEETAKKGIQQFQSASAEVQNGIIGALKDRIRTEEIKAWYSAPEGNSLFQGTSISSLTIPYTISSPLKFRSIVDLEESIANAYIQLHKRYAKKVKKAVIEDVDTWLNEGLYYGVVLSSKIISQAFNLSVKYSDVVLKIGPYTVDPHEITSFPDDVRHEYFEKCLKHINVFGDINLEQREMESSLVLADISKPKMKEYKDKIILAPVRCNEIASILSDGITSRIREKTAGKINPRSLAVVIYDTDTPYTYHRIMGYCGNGLSLILPGLTILGTSGTIEAFRWLYAYRVSLIAQKMMKGSLYSEVHRHFVPFVFFGVLVPRDAEILLDMENLHRLRYRGNLNPELECAYLIPGVLNAINHCGSQVFSWEDFEKKHLLNN